MPAKRQDCLNRLLRKTKVGVSVIFPKDIYTEDYLKKQNLPTRQVNALLYIKEHGSISNAEYQQLENISKSTATRDLQELMDKKFIERKGTTGKGTAYVFHSIKVMGS
ncbi:MarR family transcriptional regulator [Galbibacter sp. PAP.153]|uniref:MarR family transcriptional regulator n=1 Tax=Galbibacter sp. PAP.153 TaxID=3104623 RepID=UPI0030091BB8